MNIVPPPTPPPKPKPDHYKIICISAYNEDLMTELARSTNGTFVAGVKITTARLQDGALEGSNVSPVETMVAMIAAARQYDTQMQLLRNAQQNDQQASQLLSQR